MFRRLYPDYFVKQELHAGRRNVLGTNDGGSNKGLVSRQ